MTTARQPQKNKTGQKHSGLKYVITTVSIVTAIGLWNQFASRDQLITAANDKNSPEPVVNTVQGFEFSPIPTVVPAYQSQADAFIADNESRTDSLRQVNIPTMVPGENPQVKIEQVIISNPSVNTSNNNNNTFVPPVNRTGSSR